MRPVSRVAEAVAYSVPRAGAPTDLKLDGNEGARPPADLFQRLTDLEVLRQYPDASALRARAATWLGVGVEQVLVTAGADDALDRTCRALLEPGRQVLLPGPGFAMTTQYARLTGATIVDVPWPRGAYPTDAVLAAVTDATALIVVTTPNNPTGAVATAEDLRRLSAGAPDALLLVDLAYGEFADDDLTAAALALPNALVLRTLSKAWGLAGLRVGFAAGPPSVIRWLAAAAAPYPVSGPSLALGALRLEEGEADMRAFVACIRDERRRLTNLLDDLGVRFVPSQANFVLFEVPDPLWFRDAMAGLGIAVRAFPERQDLAGQVRVALPGDAASMDRLEAALRTVLAPEALLLDLDGVLADVSESYRLAIQQTAAFFGREVSAADIAALKQLGDANNDWIVTWRLLGEAVPLDAVTAEFERRYQGGLRDRERLLVDPYLLRALERPVAIVTGRPRADAERFLARFDLTPTVLVCMEDAPAKPDPAPIRLALQRLGCARAWMVGDTVDDIAAARAAGVLPVGVVAPGDDADATRAALTRAGAARVLDNLTELFEVL